MADEAKSHQHIFMPSLFNNRKDYFRVSNRKDNSEYSIIREFRKKYQNNKFGKLIIKAVRFLLWVSYIANLVTLTIAVCKLTIALRIPMFGRDDILSLFCLFEIEKPETKIIPIVVVVWTFSTVLLVFMLGKVNDRAFGVHLGDVMWTIDYSKFMDIPLSIINIAFFLFAPFVWIAIIVIGWTCYLWIEVVKQLLYLLIILLLTIACLSRSTIIEIIFEQTNTIFDIKMRGKPYSRLLLTDMATYLNYNDIDEVELLDKVLLLIDKKRIDEDKRYCIPERNNYRSRCRQYIQRIFERIVVHTEPNAAVIIKRRFSNYTHETHENTNNDRMRDSLTLDIQKGIIASLSYDNKFDNFLLCKELFQMVPNDCDDCGNNLWSDRTELIFWYCLQLKKDWTGNTKMLYEGYVNVAKIRIIMSSLYEKDELVITEHDLWSLVSKLYLEICEDEGLMQESRKKLYVYYSSFISKLVIEMRKNGWICE